MIAIGTAGWNVPRAVASSFETPGRHLERYARVMRCVEIDSSFHRPHRLATYARWAAETPPAFRFAVKLPRTVTHDARLDGAEAPLERFLAEVAGLGEKLGVLLVQLPPSLAFDARVVDRFFAGLRARHAGAVVCEPRHATWFEPAADALLARRRVGRVAADPASCAAAAMPGGWLGNGAVVYFRWHGSPRVYWSAYDDDWLAARVGTVCARSHGHDVWCVFDNTAAGAALDDALRFAPMVEARCAG